MFIESHMSKRSPVAIFLAASAFLSLNTVQSEASKASEHKEKDRMELGHQEIDEHKYAFHHKKKDHHKHQDHEELGGLKEWTTDQGVEDEGQLDESAKKAASKAKKQNVCIPIGEGENCW